jgi:hypothetical protein
MEATTVSSRATNEVPGVEHDHVKRVVLLRKVAPVRRFNDGPFRLLHLVAYVAFMYLWFTESQDPSAAGALASNGTMVVDDLGTQPVTTVEDSSLSGADELDELDGVVHANAFNETSGEGEHPIVYEMWEPKSPKDYALVAWALVAIAHALTNLFCVWVVRMKVFCQFRRVRSLPDADHVLCIPDPAQGTPAITTLSTPEVVEPGTDKKVRHCRPALQSVLAHTALPAARRRGGRTVLYCA